VNATPEEQENHPFVLMVDYIINTIVRKSVWKRQAGSSALSSFVTCTDEAFAMLVLENSWDIWVDRYEKKENEESLDEDVISTKKLTQKYTNNGGIGKRYGGWDHNGFSRFNELYDLVYEHRQTAESKELETWYMAYTVTKDERMKQKGMSSSDYASLVQSNNMVHSTVTPSN
jgi:hypothetical protein